MTLLSFEGQNTKNFEKVCMWTAAISFAQKILSAELVLCFTLHLFDLQIFFITMPQEARKGKSWGGTSMRATKRILWVFTACKQLEKPRDKMRILLGCSTTHGRAKLVPHWIPQSHQTFLLFSFYEDENRQGIFLRFRPDMKKSYS